MREIKFRAWNGDYFEYSNFNFKTGCLGCNFSCYVEIDTPDQFTGIKDVNGVDIYEGDIVEHRKNLFFDHGTEKSIIEFESGKFLTNGSDLNMVVNDFSGEVIGNVYENPGLLEDKQ